MAEDRTPRTDSLSGQIPCPPDDRGCEEETKHNLRRRRTKVKYSASEDRRAVRVDDSLPLRPLN